MVTMPAPLMAIERIPDWRRRIERVDAFWDRRILDRPVAWITLPAERPEHPWPESKRFASYRDRWLDPDHTAAWALASVDHTEYLGDALPLVNPNLGPEVFSAFFGAELHFSETTSWSVPPLADWRDADRLEFSEDNAYWRALERITDALLAAGRGRFYTGITDLHPGADAVAAFRDPAVFNVDLLEHPEDVARTIRRVTDAFFLVYDRFADRLQAAGQAIGNWTRVVSTKRHYVPSNDFSCMISPAMFDRFFLPGLAEECRHLEASLYHLDGPDAVRHLDSLLAIPELNAVQWVCGAGKGPTRKWLPLYRRIQAAGKGIQILDLPAADLDLFIANLKPEGLWLDLTGIATRDEAQAVLRKIERWGR